MAYRNEYVTITMTERCFQDLERTLQDSPHVLAQMVRYQTVETHPSTRNLRRSTMYIYVYIHTYIYIHINLYKVTLECVYAAKR